MEKYYVLIQAGIVLLVFLMGTFTAKRLNFIHGAITLVAIITFIAGISAVLCQYALEGGKEVGIDSYYLNLTLASSTPDLYLEGLTGIEMVTKYMIYFTLPLQYVATYFVNGILVFNLPEQINEYLWILYFAPTVIWLVSRILAGIFRR